MPVRWIHLVALLCSMFVVAPAFGLDMQRCKGRVLRVGDWATQAEALCGNAFYVDRWQEVLYADLDPRRSLRQRIDWNDAYFDLGQGHQVFRVRSRQGRIVAIDTLGRRGGPALSGDCSLAALKRRQPVGEVVHRCGLPAQRIDLGVAVVDSREPIVETQDLRHQQWLYPAAAGQMLIVEIREGRLLGAALR